MAFDEQGQADTVERKVAIAHRAYDLLTEQAGFAPEDIILDPNIFAIGTGIEEHADYAVAYIEATRRIKAELPGVLVSGGVSNVSFSFRGNDPVREAIHSVFLYHAIAAGMDMGIVNAGQLAIYDDIDPELRELVEDVVLNRRPDATERLLAVADRGRRAGAGRRRGRARLARAAGRGAADPRPRRGHRRLHRRGHRGGPAGRRPPDRGHRGPADGRHERRRRPVRLREDVPAAGRQERPRHEEGRRPPRPVHRGREGAGRVAVGRPRRDGDRQGRRPRHRQEHRRRRAPVQQLRGPRPRRDGAVGEDPRDRARVGRRPHRPVGADHAVARGDVVRGVRDGAAGLHDPAADRRRDDVPGAHGGQDRAALPRARSSTSSTRRGRSASPRRSLDREQRDAFAAGVRDEYAQVRHERGERQEREARHPIAEARANRFAIDWTGPGAVRPPRPTFLGVRTIEAHPLDDLVDRIDWTPFFATWELRGAYPAILDDPIVGAAARDLHRDARRCSARIVDERLLTAKAAFGFWPANSVGDDIELYARDARVGGRRRRPHAPPADGQAARPAEPRPGRLHGAPRDRRRGLRRRVRGHRRARPRRGRRPLRGRPRRLLVDPRQGARRPPRRGVRRAAARAGPARASGATRPTSGCRTTRSSARSTRASGRRPAIPACPDHTEKGRCSSCWRRKRGPGSG